MEALNAPFVAEFRANVREYLQTYYAEKCEAIGPAGVEALIDRGIAKSSRYGIETEDDVFDLIEVMFENGANFETAPGMAWAAEILNDSSATGSERMGRLVAWLETARNQPARR